MSIDQRSIHFEPVLFTHINEGGAEAPGRVVGFVADGVTGLELVLRGGARVSVEVRSLGFFIHELAGHLEGVVVTTVNGTIDCELFYPAGLWQVSSCGYRQ